MKLAVVALTAVCSLGAVVLASFDSAQDRQNAPTFQPPRTADGKPDFTGMYQWPTYLPGAQRGRSAATVFDSKNFAPFRPGGENFLEPRTGDPRHDEPRDFCLPAGFPGSILSGNAMQWFQTKNYLTIVHEFQRNSRIIPLDGRPHRTGTDPMYDGEPVGHWEATRSSSTRPTSNAGSSTTTTTRTRRNSGCTATRCTRSSACGGRAGRRCPTSSRSTIRRSSRSPVAGVRGHSKPEWDKIGLFEYVCDNNRCPGGKCKE
jgi:hypothetical protein